MFVINSKYYRLAEGIYKNKEDIPTEFFLHPNVWKIYEDKDLSCVDKYYVTYKISEFCGDMNVDVVIVTTLEDVDKEYELYNNEHFFPGLFMYDELDVGTYKFYDYQTYPIYNLFPNYREHSELKRIKNPNAGTV